MSGHVLMASAHNTRTAANAIGAGNSTSCTPAPEAPALADPVIPLLAASHCLRRHCAVVGRAATPGRGCRCWLPADRACRRALLPLPSFLFFFFSFLFLFLFFFDPGVGHARMPVAGVSTSCSSGHLPQFTCSPRPAMPADLSLFTHDWATIVMPPPLNVIIAGWWPIASKSGMSPPLLLRSIYGARVTLTIVVGLFVSQRRGGGWPGWAGWPTGGGGTSTTCARWWGSWA